MGLALRSLLVGLGLILSELLFLVSKQVLRYVDALEGRWVQLNPNQKRLKASSRRVWGWVRRVDIWPFVMDSRRTWMYAVFVSIAPRFFFYLLRREIPFTAMLRIMAGSMRD